MNVGLSDYQLICCTRKVSRVKTGGVHKKIKFRSLKNYAVDAYNNALKKINISDYEYFEDINRAHWDFFPKLMTMIDNIAPCKTKQVKGNSENWFDGELFETLRSRETILRLHIDIELYEKAKYDAEKIIAAEKQAFFDEKLSESVGKPK